MGLELSTVGLGFGRVDDIPSSAAFFNAGLPPAVSLPFTALVVSLALTSLYVSLALTSLMC